MNKDELVTAVAKQSHSTKKEIKVVVDTLFDIIASAMHDGETVSIVNFGKFDIVHRPERKCKDFKTGEMTTMPEMNLPHFKPSLALKELVK